MKIRRIMIYKELLLRSKALINTAAQWQLIESNPAERVKPPKVTQPKLLPIYPFSTFTSK